MLRLILALAAVLSLAACGAEPKWATDEAVARARYVHDGPPSITLYTVTATRDGSGAHSGLLINGSERIIFDPAGTWYHPFLPERNDVHFGMSPRMVSFYIDYHARETYDVWEQTLVVSPGVAELVAARAKAYGAVPKAHCTQSVSSILRGVPGLEALPQTYFPVKLRNAFGEIPGVTTRKISDDDADNNHGVLMVQASDPLVSADQVSQSSP
jgi:hypothetical protein